MRKLFWLIAAAALLYTGYWMIGAKGTESAITHWVDTRRADGWHAEAGAVKTSGFPLRFDTTLTDITFGDPSTGLAYSAPYLSIESASYAPTELTARFAPQALVASPFQKISINQGDAFARLFVDAGPALALDHTTFSLADVALSSDLGWGLTLVKAEITSQRHEDNPLIHDVNFTGADLAPTQGFLAMLDGNALLAERFETLDVQMTATFSHQWDISALEEARPQPTHIKLRHLTAKWGKLDLNLAGAFDVDDRGVADGKIAIKARNWREMLDIAVATGAIPKDMENLALRAGKMLAGLKGNADTIDAELTLSNGMLLLGFIPIGPAPNFTIR